MTTFTNFVPSPVAAFQFQATLDGQVYTVVVTWNLFRSANNENGGFFINIYAADGTLILCTALAGSATGIALESLTWASGLVTGTTSVPHGYKLGRIVALTITGATPAAYNGLVNALVTGPSTFSYPLASNPGVATAFGTASYNVNLIGGVPNASGIPFASTLVFRQQAQQFEVSP